MSTNDQSEPEQLFQTGLETILAPYRARGASEQEIEDVTSRARSFFLQQQQQQSQQGAHSRSEANNAAQTDSVEDGKVPSPSGAADHQEMSSTSDPVPSTTTSDVPPYPPSFAQLAHLIATGAPIPGIKHIPDKLADGQPSQSTLAVQARSGDNSALGRKPWEKQQQPQEQEQREPPRNSDVNYREQALELGTQRLDLAQSSQGDEQHNDMVI